LRAERDDREEHDRERERKLDARGRPAAVVAAHARDERPERERYRGPSEPRQILEVVERLARRGKGGKPEGMLPRNAREPIVEVGGRFQVERERPGGAERNRDGERDDDRDDVSRPSPRLEDGKHERGDRDGDGREKTAQQEREADAQADESATGHGS